MRRLLRNILGGMMGIAYLASGCGPDRAEQIPVEHFFSYAEKTSFRISPDGRYVSYFANTKSNDQDEDDGRHLFLMDMEAPDLQAERIKDTVNGVYSYHW